MGSSLKKNQLIYHLGFISNVKIMENGRASVRQSRSMRGPRASIAPQRKSIMSTYRSSVTQRARTSITNLNGGKDGTRIQPVAETHHSQDDVPEIKAKSVKGLFSQLIDVISWIRIMCYILLLTTLGFTIVNIVMRYPDDTSGLIAIGPVVLLGGVFLYVQVSGYLRCRCQTRRKSVDIIGDGYTQETYRRFSLNSNNPTFG